MEGTVRVNLIGSLSHIVDWGAVKQAHHADRDSGIEISARCRKPTLWLQLC